jgi:hypothetical protein
MEEAGLQELLQIADDAQVGQRANIIRSALAKFFPIQPLRREHSACCEGLIRLWNFHLLSTGLLTPKHTMLQQREKRCAQHIARH